jgi:hypothetical protein
LIARGTLPYRFAMIESFKIHASRQSGDREFGLVMFGAFTLFSLASAWKHHARPALYFPALALLFLVTSLIFPRGLRPLNFAWAALGALLHRLLSPLLLGLLYFVVFTPLGLLFRAVKKDPLRLSIDPAAESYWILRKDQPGKGMANQF